MMGVTVWLARWSRQSEEEQDKRRYVVVLALLAVAAVIVSLFRAILTFFSLVKVRKAPSFLLVCRLCLCFLIAIENCGR